MILEIANRGRGGPAPRRVEGSDWAAAAGTRPVVRV